MTTWRTTPAIAVQGAQTPCTRRLRVPYVHVPADTLPNGLARPERVKIEAAFTLGGDFCFLARVVRDRQLGTLLQVESEAFDKARDQAMRLILDGALLSEVYGELSRCYLAWQGRRYAREEGRN